jgi:hypothetical protein
MKNQFKAWDKKRKVMTMPFGITDIGNNGIIKNQRTDMEYYNINDCEVLMIDNFSGLTEGDIVEKDEIRLLNGEKEYLKNPMKGIVVFEQGAFGVKWNDYHPIFKKVWFFCDRLHLGEKPWYKKIGTIYENKELASQLSK